MTWKGLEAENDCRICPPIELSFSYTHEFFRRQKESACFFSYPYDGTAKVFCSVVR